MQPSIMNGRKFSLHTNADGTGFHQEKVRVEYWGLSATSLALSTVNHFPAPVEDFTFMYVCSPISLSIKFCCFHNFLCPLFVLYMHLRVAKYFWHKHAMSMCKTKHLQQCNHCTWHPLTSSAAIMKGTYLYPIFLIYFLLWVCVCARHIVHIC